MKLNKLYYALLMAILMVTLNACGSDDDDTTHSNADMLKGETWTFQKAVVNAMGQSMEMNLSQIRQLYESEFGTSNIMFIDQYLKFEDEYVVMVNTGERLRYKYYSNGKLWIEGMDEIEYIDITLRVKSLNQSQLVLRYEVKVEGTSITEDVYYKR